MDPSHPEPVLQRGPATSERDSSVRCTSSSNRKCQKEKEAITEQHDKVVNHCWNYSNFHVRLGLNKYLNLLISKRQNKKLEHSAEEALACRVVL